MATVLTQFLDRCIWTPASGGTGSFVLSAAVAGFQTMAAAGAVNATVYGYAAQSADLTQWEVGTGTWTTATSTLTRTVLFNSLGTTAAVSFTSPPQVMITAIAETLVGFDAGFSYAPGLLSLSNGATATALRVYNTTDSATSPTNFARGVFDWTTAANTLTIGTQTGGTGTGTVTGLQISVGGAVKFDFGVTAGNTTTISGQFINFGGFLLGNNSSGILTVNNSTPLAWASAAGFASPDVGLSRAAPKVIQFNDGNVDTNGWMQWAGQARVTADVTVTSSTVLTNATGLAVALQAGRTYSFEAQLSFTDAAAGGIQAAMVASAGLTATNIIYDGWIVDSGANGIKGNTQATALGGVVASAATTGTAGHVSIYGVITVNVAGTLNVQFAQNTSNATATTVKRGSYMLVQDMP